MKYFKIFENGKYVARCFYDGIPEQAGREFIEIPVEEMAPSRPGYTVDENGDFTVAPSKPTQKELILSQIAQLENSVTERMRQEAAIGSTLTGLGPDKTMTAFAFIASVREQINALRLQL